MIIIILIYWYYVAFTASPMPQGAGKSALARRLAAVWKCQLVDGKSIAAVYTVDMYHVLYIVCSLV